MTGIHHVALRVSDCDRAAGFYTQAFGLREVRRVEKEGKVLAVWLAAGETVVMLEHSLRGSGPSEGSGHVLIFATASLQDAEKRFADLGIEVRDRTPSTLYVSDPDGHRAGVSVFAFTGTAS